MLHNNRILVLAPHTDDGELGLGASMSKYVSEGKKVVYVAFSNCVHSLPDGLPADTLELECRAATATMGISETILHQFDVRHFASRRQEILDLLIRIKKEFDPQTVFIPAKNDVHQDHQVITAEALRAFNFSNLLGYELPWNNTRFSPNYFENISEHHLSAKENALACYQSQIHRPYMKPGFFPSLATVRGIQSGCTYAEAFEVYKLLG